MKKVLLLVALSVCLLPLWGQRDFSQIDSLIKKMLPEASEVGISVYDLTAKKPLYSYRADKLSRPASTMKLLTAITTLSRPDADEPFRTEVWHDGVIEHDTLQGNLYVVGGFDPEFDSQAMDSLIEEVMTFPFSVINGPGVWRRFDERLALLGAWLGLGRYSCRLSALLVSVDVL